MEAVKYESKSDLGFVFFFFNFVLSYNLHDFVVLLLQFNKI